ncbi:bifunctional transcriptional activator/DNA repair enzyme AdaA [Streptomyces maremycinicus]|uniref:bifunctional transcriptional activator/DNA repair enzyme AdaA n=1 Tax=Streptomyces maremycinicus TaxID=1679753 RepID=UPI0007887D96|nr:Ada metal-binding domain-containing protein [Streptomyces sp. NBRC 110468]
MYDSDEQRWRAVRERDEAADGRFYYVVKTTGIFSRPSCAARLARRENVEFHASLEELRTRGYRPCRRCRPGELERNRQHADRVTRTCLLMNAATEPPNLDDLARSAGYSRFHYHRVFKSLTGLTPHTYWTAVRARRVREMLIRARTVADAIYQAGFGTNGQFYAVSSAILGMTPQAFRAGGAGVEIRSAMGVSDAGPVLVAVAEKGVCAVLDGPESETRARLAELFPDARHRAGDRWLEERLARELARPATPHPGAPLLPAEVRGICRHERIRQSLRTRPHPLPGPADVPALRAG